MSKINRRDLLKILGVGSSTMALNSLFPRMFVNEAHAATTKKYLSIFLNGGCDAYMVVHPSGDSAFMTRYLINRPTLGQPLRDANGALVSRLELPGTNYSIHPRMIEFQRLFQRGQLAVINKCGVTRNASGSHEESQVHHKVGVPDGRVTAKAGVLKRIANDNNFSDPLKIIDRAGGTPATTGEGEFKPLVTQSFNDLGFSATVNGETGFRLETGFALLNQQERNAATRAFLDSYKNVQSTVDTIRSALTTTTFAAPFPNTGIGRQCRDAFIAFYRFSTTAVHAEFGGFDLHSATDPQGQNINNPMGQSRLMKELNDALEAFRLNCEAVGIWADTTVSITTEFGRTNNENGQAGLDHASGHSDFVLGGSVVGGIKGDHVTVADISNRLNSTPATTNILDVYYEIVRHMGLRTDSLLPNGYSPRTLGIF